MGRGCWAGPVVAAAVSLPYGLKLEKLNDSKLVSLQGRLRLDREIRRTALSIRLGWASAEEVDQQGLTWAVRQSSLRALVHLGQLPDIVILDGRHNFLQDLYSSQAIIKADALVVPVSAASIVAKVARDGYMALMDTRYPGYGFGVHMGYGTQRHRQALRELGISPLHRRSYRPIKELL